MAQVMEPETHTVVRKKNRLLRVVKWVLALAVLIGVAVAAYVIWERLSRVESTDDAQIDGTIVPISSRIAGYVIDNDGRRWIVVALINHRNAGRGQSAIDYLVQWVYRNAAAWQAAQ